MAGYLNLKLRGAGLESTDWLSTPPNPIYKLSSFQMGKAVPFEVVFESELILGNGTPKWKQSSVAMADLCGGMQDFPIMISVFNCAEKEELIGSCETTVSDLLRNRVGDVDDVDASKVFSLKDDNDNDNGLLVVVEASITDEPKKSSEAAENLPEGTTENGAQQPQNGSSNSSNENAFIIAELQKALEKVLQRTNELETEVSDLRYDNKKLFRKTAQLEELLAHNQTKTDEATRDISLLLKKGPSNNGDKLSVTTGNNNNNKSMKLASLLDDDDLLADTTSVSKVNVVDRVDSRATSSTPRNGIKDMDQSGNTSTMDKSDNRMNRSGRKIDGSRRHTHASATTAGEHYHPMSNSRERSRRRERGDDNHLSKSADSSPQQQQDRNSKSKTRDSSKERTTHHKTDGHSDRRERSKTRDSSKERATHQHKTDGRSAHQDRSKTRESNTDNNNAHHGGGRSAHRDRSKPRDKSTVLSPAKADHKSTDGAGHSSAHNIHFQRSSTMDDTNSQNKSGESSNNSNNGIGVHHHTMKATRSKSQTDDRSKGRSRSPLRGTALESLQF